MRRSVFWLMFAGGFGLLLGCKDPESIASYRIEKSRSGLGQFDQVRPAPAGDTTTDVVDAAEQGVDRMVVAIANRPEATWYFKITGPVDLVTSTEPQWRVFLEQVRFSAEGNPEWDVPEGWSVGATAPMRFATLVIQREPELELRVSRLGPNQDSLSNVNRWRKQLQLSDTTAADLNLGEIENPAGSMELFDEEGRFQSSRMTAPFAGGNVTRPPVRQPPSGSAKLVVPDGWEEGRTSSIVKARLLKTDGDQSAQISVTELPAAANRWLPNAQRWAGEIGMDESVEELEALTREATVDGLPGKRIRLVNPTDEGARATIGLMVVQGDAAWFFKLTGDRDLVKKSEEDFDAFLRSYRFEMPRP
ncbi:MAG: hypothetical protein MK108_16250 [Mariniblastus sp.]|nr:hypothetical protein [Mariniblastus sp.]